MIGLNSSQLVCLIELLFDIQKESEPQFSEIFFQIEDYQKNIFIETITLKSSLINDIQVKNFDVEGEINDMILQNSFIRVNPFESSKNFISLAPQKSIIKEVWRALLFKDLIILNGNPGIGKTRLIEHITEASEKNTLTLYLDNQTDFKSLLGNYTCSEKVGEFEWKKGPLVQAMEKGLYLVLENIDESSEDLLFSLISSIEKRELTLSSTGQRIKASVGFKVVGLSSCDLSRDNKFKSLLTEINKIGEIIDFNKKITGVEMRDVFNEYWRNLTAEANNQQILIIFNKVYELFTNLEQVELNNQQIRQLNITNRSFFILLNRINYQIKIIYGSNGINNPLYTTESFRKNVFIEIMDCFVEKTKDIRNFIPLIEKICNILELSLESTLTFYDQYSPDIIKSSKLITIGRLGEIEYDKFLTKGIPSNYHATQEVIYNTYTKKIIERITACILHGESCLLIGDTGCGKTTIAQHVAEIFGKNLYIYNLSQGSDAVDLIGGFKPIDMKILIKKLLEKYLKNLVLVIDEKANQQFIENLRSQYIKKNFHILLKCMLDSFDMVSKKINKMRESDQKTKIVSKWNKMKKRIENVYLNRDKIETNLVFDFIEGNLIKAIKEGDWILIDEINLANNELLQKLLPIIEGQSLMLYEKGDLKEIKRNPNFKLIACMNPGTDIGKKELPFNIRIKFTEFFIRDLEDKNDLVVLVKNLISNSFETLYHEKIVDFYLWLRKSSEAFELEDGYNKRPHFSLRNLARAIKYMNISAQTYGKSRAVYEGVYIGFGSLLSQKSQLKILKKVEETFGISKASYDLSLTQFTKSVPGYTSIYGFLLKSGEFECKHPDQTDFEVTKTFQKYITELLRILSNTTHPVLLEGPTSSGKTSIIKYIAEITGYKCVRINNHHHTDIEEYFGSYQPNSKGKLVFQEGLLVEAVKKGYWIILDELNLARSEILESLNRLLDENKELFLAEQQVHIKPHENFRLFATQNPIHYSGRKELSKAFKNRFIQIYFDEISEEDLEKIILRKAKIAPSHCKKILKVMKDLQLRRQTNNFFMGKEGAITVRDLIKWAKRIKTLDDKIEGQEITNENLAMEGYCLLAERLRTRNEKNEVKQILEDAFKCKFNPEEYYIKYTERKDFIDSRTKLDNFLRAKSNNSGIQTIQWNLSFRRMACQVEKCLKNKEPVLLIGETGCGKTTICQLMAMMYQVEFFSINCHHYTESMDFLGSLRPVRNKDDIEKNLQENLSNLNIDLKSDISEEGKQIRDILGEESPSEAKLLKLIKISDKLDKESLLAIKLQNYINSLYKKEALFEWQDGPLTQAMRYGGVFLIDEISLADDSVLERMNSVLEAERTLTLTEKTDEPDMITGHENFFILSTMNPGGDFGKRELSPALRNRFTEIWVEPITSKDYLLVEFDDLKVKFSQADIMYKDSVFSSGNDCLKMLSENLLQNSGLKFNSSVTNPDEVKIELAILIYQFLHFFNTSFCEKYLNEKKHLSLRDILTLIKFMERCHEIPAKDAFIHGLNVMIVDSLGMLFDSSQRRKVINEVEEFVLSLILNTRFVKNPNNKMKPYPMQIENDAKFSANLFSIEVKSKANVKQPVFSTSASKVQSNLDKLVRALQIEKPILLEGPPGVGKSSLVEYLAYKTGNKLLQINISEHTDLMDLLGCDVPRSQELSEILSGKLEFAWSDGVLLKALKNGYWILLNELNLANQTVLEGMNACLDHRGSVFIPELNKEFKRHPNFRIFASQNPIQQGGGRKSLPSSFLNRFSKVFIEEYSDSDFISIIIDLFQIDSLLAKKIIDFNARVRQICRESNYNQNWEFNLRDVLKVCQMLSAQYSIQDSVDLIYLKRFWREDVIEHTIVAFEKIFELKFSYEEYLDIPIFLHDSSSLKISYFSKNQMAMKEFKKNNQILYRSKNLDDNRLLEFNLYRYASKSIFNSIEMGWAVILTGNKEVDKSTFIKAVASSLNQKVLDINLNSGTDTTDLIGNYDQDDMLRRLDVIKTELESYIVGEIYPYLLGAKDVSIFSLLCGLQKSLSLLKSSTSPNETSKLVEEIIHSLEINSRFFSDIQKFEERVINFKHQINSFIKLHQSNNSRVWFSWFDSELIKAVNHGDWLILHNTDACNSALLERLNPLFEKNSKLYINEHSSSDGETSKVTIHPNFKIFLLSEDENCKLSRAIRNRCIEIHVTPYLKSSDRCQSRIQHFWNSIFMADINLSLLADQISVSALRNTFIELIIDNIKKAPLTVGYCVSLDRIKYFIYDFIHKRIFGENYTLSIQNSTEKLKLNTPLNQAGLIAVESEPIRSTHNIPLYSDENFKISHLDLIPDQEKDLWKFSLVNLEDYLNSRRLRRNIENEFEFTDEFTQEYLLTKLNQFRCFYYSQFNLDKTKKILEYYHISVNSKEEIELAFLDTILKISWSKFESKLLSFRERNKNKVGMQNFVEILNSYSPDIIIPKIKNCSSASQRVIILATLSLYSFFMNNISSLVSTIHRAKSVLQIILNKLYTSLNTEVSIFNQETKINQETKVLKKLFKNTRLFMMLPKRPEFYEFIDKITYLLNEDPNNTKYLNP